jgi:small subunit ribosomal protein S2
MFVIDVCKEHIAVREAKRLNIPLFAIVDTNSDPSPIDFPIPGNDDASKSISLILDKITDAIREGLEERKLEKDKEGPSKDKGKSDKSARTDSRKTRARKPRTEESEVEELEDEVSAEAEIDEVEE